MPIAQGLDDVTSQVAISRVTPVMKTAKPPCYVPSLVGVYLTAAVFICFGILKLLLAPESPCRCGGFDHWPDEVLWAVLLVALMSALYLYSNPQPHADRLSLAPTAHSGFRRTPLSMPLAAGIVATVGQVAAAQQDGAAVGTVDSIVANGTMTAAYFDTNGIVSPPFAEYEVTVTFRGDAVEALNTYPDGSAMRALLHLDKALEISFNPDAATSLAASPQPAEPATTRGDVTESDLFRNAAGTVFDTTWSHTGLGPSAFVWLAFFGGEHTAAGGYLKPPHMSHGSSFAWLTECDTTLGNAEPGVYPQLQRVTWRIRRTDPDWDRARTVLRLTTTQWRQRLRDAAEPFSEYPEGFTCEHYRVLQSTNVDGRTYPTHVESIAYTPFPTRNESTITVLSRPSVVRKLRLDYISVEAESLPSLELDTAITFQDVRAVTTSGRSLPVFYHHNRLEIPTIDSELYLSALSAAGPRLQSKRSRIIIQSMICVLTIVTIAFAARVLWRAAQQTKETAARTRTDGQIN